MKHICIGITAHVDAGKTTLSEAMLYQAGALKKLGRVDHQDAFLDTFALERARGITIFSKQAEFSLPHTEVTLLDTPGHVDFSAEMERTLQVLDCAVLVISGTDGVPGAYGNAVAAADAAGNPDISVHQQDGFGRRRPKCTPAGAEIAAGQRLCGLHCAGHNGRGACRVR